MFEERTKLQNTFDDFYNGNVPKRAQLPILQLYLDGQLSEEMVKQNIETLLMAGFETTGEIFITTILIHFFHPFLI